ncbi:MAG: hypothetical protein ABR915_09935 [Thermoguttaceae bacterium]|jgi:hypothetical protein
MIIENSRGGFGAKLSILQGPSGRFVTISTAEEGLLSSLSTMVMEGMFPSLRPCAKVIYSRSLRKSDRQQLHEVIVAGIDHGLDVDGLTLHDAINLVCGELQRRGAISELINIAS